MDNQAKKIWITRAQPGADLTARRVRALGHDPIVAPLLTISALTPDALDLADVGALAFTSANGVRAFADLTARRDFRVFAVGAATAKTAKEVGFRQVLSADGDVAALAAGIAARKSDLKGVVLHPGASDPAGDLSAALSARGIISRRLDLYDTVQSLLPPGLEEQALEADVVLLHSPKAAAVLAVILRRHPRPDLKALALSKAVLRPLARTKLALKSFAPFPLEAALLNLIDRTP